MPFGSLENPFAKPVQRSKDNAELVGLILGPEHEAAMREVLGSPPPDNEDLFAIGQFEDHELTDREQLEVTYELSRQYDEQTRRLKSLGLLERNSEDVEFIRGIDGLEYPLPSLEIIASRLLEQKETLDIKAEQGFTKLILVPFAVSLDRQRQLLKQFLVDYIKKHPDVDLNQHTPVWSQEEYFGADINEELVYDVKLFDADPKKHQGLTKRQILKTQKINNDPVSGWRVKLFQADRNTRGIRGIPRADEGKIDGKIHQRPEIEANKTPNEYLADQLPGETGMTPEDWIYAFIFHLQETGKPLDDIGDDDGALVFLTGAWFRYKNCVPCTYVNQRIRQACFNLLHPAFPVENYGSRSSVLV